MRTRDYLILYLAAELVLIGVAIFQSMPGYMDADYYMAGGLQIKRGNAHFEPYLWNYLGGAEKLPVESFQYWMPLTAVFSFGGMALLGSNTFTAARLLLILLAGLTAPMTAAFAFRYSMKRRIGWFAGLLAIFPGFYLPFLTTTDAFAIYMVVGGLLLFGLDHLSPQKYLWLSLSSGFCAGLLHMARADGLIWLMLVFITYLLWGIAKRLSPWRVLFSVILIAAGYLSITSPWYWRNLGAFGSLFPPGSSKTLWLTNYDELFRYDTSGLTLHHWLQSGWAAIIRVRVWAIIQNLQTLLAVQGSVFLLPLILLGAWKQRHRLSVQVSSFYWLMLFLGFSILLPFPGVRGSFFHSGSSVQILFWALVPIGLNSLIQFAANKRKWDTRQAERVFQVGAICMAIFLTLFLSLNKLYVDGIWIWGKNIEQYRAVGDFLEKEDQEFKSPVMVNNPPGYFLATGEEAIVIPADGVEAIFAAAQSFGVRYLLLESEKNFPAIYRGEVEVPGLRLVTQVDGIQVYQIATVRK